MGKDDVPVRWGERLERALRDLVGGLGKARVRYCVIGALALGAWGQPRTTQDLDVLVALEGVRRERMLRALQRRGFEVDKEWAKHNPMIREWQIRLRRHGVPVDLLLPRDNHDRSVLDRRRLKKLGAIRLWLISREDLILHKLKAGRPRDFEDALSVIVRQGRRLDAKYLNHWGRRLGVREELAYLSAR